MKKIIFLLLLTTTIYSCNEQIKTTEIGIKPQDSEEKLLIERQKYVLNNAEKNIGYYDNFKYVENKESALESLKIIEKIEVSNSKVIVVFYSFNIGIDMIRETLYMIKENDKYYILNKYFSSYDDDPFENGNPKEGKEILRKIDNWKDDNYSIEWRN